jgi:hypothetical protein
LSIAIVLGGATSAPLPKDVAAHVGEMDKSCEEEGGTPQPSGTWEPFEGHFKFQPRRLVEHVVLAGSSAEVWAIDEGRYRCGGDGPASLFSGSGGSQVYVFVRMKDGAVKQAFRHGAYGASLKRIGSSSQLSLVVGGVLCGQVGDPTHADSINCERPLIWDNAAQKMDFAPLSQAKFPFAKDGQSQ